MTIGLKRDGGGGGDDDEEEKTTVRSVPDGSDNYSSDSSDLTRAYMGQFLQGGKNGHFVSYFFKK